MAGAIQKKDIATIDGLAEELEKVANAINRIVTESSNLKSIKGLSDLNKAKNETTESTKKLTAAENEIKKINEQIVILYARMNDEYQKLNKEKQQLNILQSQENALIKEEFTGKNKSIEQKKEEKRINKEIEQQRKFELQAKRAAIKAAFDEDAASKKVTTTKQAEATSYDALNAELNETIKAYKALTQAQRDDVAVGGAMIKNITALDAQLKQLDAGIGRHQRNVGNYKSAFNGLNFSILQIGRELPSLAYGFNVFVGALSNNIPMMTDEIKKARLEFAALKAEGKAAVPVWKQVLGAVFSWQTAMVVGITVLTMYGREIATWVKGLFGGVSASEKLKIAQERLNEANKKGYEDGQKDIVRLKLLYNATQNHSMSIDEKRKAIKELQDQYPDYLGKFSEEEILAGKAGKAYYELTNAIMASAKAKAYEQIIVENEVKKLELETKILEDRKKLIEAEKELKRAGNTFENVTEGSEMYAASVVLAQKKVDSLKESIRQTNVEISQIEFSSKELAANIKPTDLLSNLGQVKSDKDGKDESIKEQERLSKLRQDLRNDDHKIWLDSEKEINKEIEDQQKEFDKQIKDEIKETEDYKRWLSNQTLSEAEEEIHNEAMLKLLAAEEEIKNAKGNAEKIRKIQDELELYLIESEKRILQAKLDSGNLTSSDAEQVQKRINSLEEGAVKKRTDNTTKGEETKKQKFQETAQATNELLQQGLEFSQMIYSAQAERAQETYDAEMRAAGDNLEQQTLAKRKFEVEDKKIKQRQAIASKLQAVLDAGLALALAIATTWKNPFLAALNIGAATIGLGMALATPIPQFEEGKENTPDTFIAGDKKGSKGATELIKLKSGKKILTPSQPILFSGSEFEGATVFPNMHSETQKMLSNMAFNQVREVVDMRETNSHLASMDKQMKNKTERYTDSKGRTVVKRGTVTSIL